jgi:hypothetical protein
VPHIPLDGNIYYGYTEVWSDRDQHRYVLFGSDDYGKAWICPEGESWENKELIYVSGKTPHPWIPDRGIKKVHFRKGVNRILFKCENAWGRTGFSVIIYVGPEND